MAWGFTWSLGCGHGVTGGYGVAWLMVVCGEGGITGNPWLLSGDRGMATTSELVRGERKEDKEGKRERGGMTNNGSRL